MFIFLDLSYEERKQEKNRILTIRTLLHGDSMHLGWVKVRPILAEITACRRVRAVGLWTTACVSVDEIEV